MTTTTSIAPGEFSEEEQPQLRINIKKFTINYKPATVKDIVFSPSMLELGETEYALGSANSSSSGSSSSSSSGSSVGSTRLKQSVRGDRSAVYLPDTHKIRPVFMKYYKQYSPTIGNPALVFIDKATFLDYMKYATKLISDEQKKVAAAAAATPPLTLPSQFVDLNKERQLNDNIKFVIETIFSKNRVLTIGGDFKVQVTVGGRKVLLNQEYYIESLPTIVDKSTPTNTVPIYASADSEIIDLEGKADEKKQDIDTKEIDRKHKELELETAQGTLNVAKNALRTAINAVTVPPMPLSLIARKPLDTAIRNANDKLLEARTAYKKAREEEKIAISERAIILNKINQYKYGRENSKITDILTKVSSLKREKAAKELEIEKNKLSIKKVDGEITKKRTDIDTMKGKLTAEIKNAAKIYDIGITDINKNNDTILADITAAYTQNANRIKYIQQNNNEKLNSDQKPEHDKKVLQNSQYDIIAKMIKKLMDTLKVDKELVDISSNSSLLTKKKTLEATLTTLNVEKDKKNKEIEKLNLSLYDYTLRVYIFDDMPPLSLISKYLENGKENPQFARMHKKFYKAIEAEETSLSRVGSSHSFLSTVNCAKDRTEIGKMVDNLVGSAKRSVEDAIDGIGIGTQIQHGGAGAMDKIKAALRHPADDPPVYEDDPDSGGWTAKILEKPGEDDTDTSKYVSMVGMGKYPLYFTLFGLYRMHKPTVDPPTKDTIDVVCETPPPDRHSRFTVDNLNLLLSDDQPVPDMFPPVASDMSVYSKGIKDVRIPYENYKFNNVN